MKKYYVVWQGRQTGVFESWDECKKHIHGFKGASFKSFTDRDEAYRQFHSLKEPTIPEKYLAVDVGCRGKIPNLFVEYRLVLVDEIVYQSPVYPNGTNNIGEFLAIVHGIGWLEKQGLKIPLFTDSRTAMSWVKKGYANTTLKRSSENLALFDLLERAKQFLSKPHDIEILKWQTHLWGEIPADYGRK